MIAMPRVGWIAHAGTGTHQVESRLWRVVFRLIESDGQAGMPADLKFEPAGSQLPPGRMQDAHRWRQERLRAPAGGQFEVRAAKPDEKKPVVAAVRRTLHSHTEYLHCDAFRAWQSKKLHIRKVSLDEDHTRGQVLAGRLGRGLG